MGLTGPQKLTSRITQASTTERNPVSVTKLKTVGDFSLSVVCSRCWIVFSDRKTGKYDIMRVIWGLARERGFV